jgi:hypothetical protein
MKMPPEQDEAVTQSLTLDEQRQRIADIVTKFLPELVGRLVVGEVPPIILSVVMASESGVYANAVTNRTLCDSGMANELVATIADHVKMKIMEMDTLTCYPEPDANAPRS